MVYDFEISNCNGHCMTKIHNTTFLLIQNIHRDFGGHLKSSNDLFNQTWFMGRFNYLCFPFYYIKSLNYKWFMQILTINPSHLQIRQISLCKLYDNKINIRRCNNIRSKYLISTQGPTIYLCSLMIIIAHPSTCHWQNY